jgi:hypothetical protein
MLFTFLIMSFTDFFSMTKYKTLILHQKIFETWARLKFSF